MNEVRKSSMQGEKTTTVNATQTRSNRPAVRRKKQNKFMLRAKLVAAALSVASLAGIATLVSNISNSANAYAETGEDNLSGVVLIEDEEEIDATVIRCSVDCTEGYTRSGEYTREGVIGGKYEWLGKKCNLYVINDDGSIGDKIGSYEFLDTGYGIDGSMERGESVTVWRPTMDACWDWLATYGDYVFIEFID